MKLIMENEDELEDQEEIYFQSYEKCLKDIHILDIKSDKETYKGVYTHCVNSYFDFAEPELEKTVENWIHFYNLQDIIRSCDILPLLFHHIDIDKMITKEYIVDNPECVSNYIHSKINNEEKTTHVREESYTTIDNLECNKKFDWSTRKYVE